MTTFKTDENLPVEAAALLREHGLDAATVIEQKLGGHPDSDVAAVCKADTRRRTPRGSWSSDLLAKTRTTSSACSGASWRSWLGSTFAGRLWIVEETRIRERA